MPRVPQLIRRRAVLRLAALLTAFCLGGCAPIARTDPAVRVLVFNIHAGKDASSKPNLEEVANLVRETSADVVLLQEVDRGTRRSANVDQVRVLSDATSFGSAFGKSLDYDGGEYGIAALSRTGFVATKTHPLPTTPPQPRAGGAVEPRVALDASTRTPIGAVHVINTHLDASGVEEYRLQESAHLLAIIRERLSSETPVLVGGDFNAEPDSKVLERLREAGLRDAWAECGQGDGLTYPAGKPVKRIDYLFLTSSLGCRSARVIETTISDHRPLLVAVVANRR
jgi:endonuclease/exonuclease/phosphatase family metal-dependent hydrolase